MSAAPQHVRLRAVMRPVYRLLEHPAGYALNQVLAKPTSDRFRALIAEHVPPRAGRRVLDVGCGTGGYRTSLPGDYCGIDINPAYVAAARRRLPGSFAAMDATRLALADDSFDDVVSVAITHHLDDRQIVQMIAEAARVARPGGRVHVLDAILPVSGNVAFKRLWFGLDRGAFPRTMPDLLALAAQGATVLFHETRCGPLHDVAYLALAPARDEGRSRPA